MRGGRVPRVVAPPPRRAASVAAAAAALPGEQVELERHRRRLAPAPLSSVLGVIMRLVLLALLRMGVLLVLLAAVLAPESTTFASAAALGRTVAAAAAAAAAAARCCGVRGVERGPLPLPGRRPERARGEARGERIDVRGQFTQHENVPVAARRAIFLPVRRSRAVEAQVRGAPMPEPPRPLCPAPPPAPQHRVVRNRAWNGETPKLRPEWGRVQVARVARFARVARRPVPVQCCRALLANGRPGEAKALHCVLLVSQRECVYIPHLCVCGAFLVLIER